MKHTGVAEKLKKAGLRPPQMLTLALTGACNLQCAHCWVDAGLPGSSAHVPTPHLHRVIEEFATLGGQGIRLTGGEPLCHPDWRSLMQTARESGLRRIALQTNAMLLSEKDMALLRELDFSGLSIQISLDGARAASHDLVRGPGAFYATMEAIHRLAGAGLARRTSLFFTEMRHNLDELPAVLELADRMDIASVAAGTLVRCGRATEDAVAVPPGPEQYVRLMERYDDDLRFRELYAKLGSVAALEWQSAPARRQECCTFVENPYLAPDGHLYPCVLLHAEEYAVPGVFDKDLARAFEEGIPAWTALLGASRRRADALTECRKCPEESACRGGCMGRAWGSSGDLHAADDRCELRRSLQKKND